MPAKVPAVTLSLVKDEMFKRGWESVVDSDFDGLVFRRGDQGLVLANDRLRSSRFRMTTFMRELDALDQRSR